MSGPYDSVDRTARWVQQHSQHRSLHGSQHYPRLKHQDGQSSQQSSRTDLGAPEHAAGSNGRAPRPRPTASVLAVAGSTQESHIQRAAADETPLSSSTYGHRRARSQSNSLPQERHQRPPLKLPAKFYENAPAFVQGPPGSGYPMVMSTADPPTTRSGRVVMRGPPSPPPQVPSALNPKVSICLFSSTTLEPQESYDMAIEIASNRATSSTFTLRSHFRGA